MSWIKKWKELNKKQEAKDIEYCKTHPKIWKGATAVLILGYSPIIILCIVYGAIPIAIIGIVFLIWMYREMKDRYAKAFPKNVIL